jgi:hypothetical protein
VVRGAPELTAGEVIRSLVVAGVLAGVVGGGLAGCGSGAPETANSAPPTTGPSATTRPAPAGGGGALCGSRAGNPAVAKVLVIYEENKDYSSIIGAAGAPYITSVARACGLATDYSAATHPSLPNYLQTTSGVSFARPPFAGDCSPRGSCVALAGSIFAQEAAAGHQWRSYEESMPSNCDPVTTDLYAARHNPAVYYPAVAPDCRRWDVPLGNRGAGPLAAAVAGGSLPAFSVVTPNVNDDMHDGTVGQGDAWLSRWLPAITAGPDYRSGRLAVFIVWDEGSGFGNQRSHVALLALSQSTPAGTRFGAPTGEDALLRAWESLTGVGYLGGAATAPSLAGAFGL